MSKSQQRKGRAAEIELSNLLNEHGFDTRPGNPMSFGKTPDISGLTGIHIEVKRTEKTHLNAWMAQAEADAERFGDGAPTVFHRMSRQPWLVTMKLTDWIELYRRGKDE